METRGVYEFGPFHIDPVERLLVRDGAPVPLPPKAFDTLLVLIRNSGRLLTKEELMKAIWPDTYVEEASLAQNISVLRKTLGEGAGEHQFIETVPRRGYRFLVTVVEKPVASPRAEPAENRISKAWRPTGLCVGAAAVAGLIAGAVLTLQWVARRSDQINPQVVTPLAASAGLEVHPSWASNGKTIAFAGEVDGAFQIFTRTLGSSMPTQVTRLPKDCFFPIWSPDGRQIFFTSGASTFGRSTLDLWSVGSAGGIPNLVLENVRQATLSPDGRALAFIRGAAGTGFGELWISSPPGSPPRRYTEPPLADPKYSFGSSVHFSPDGSKLGASLLSLAGKTEFWILPFPSGKPFQAHQNLHLNPMVHWPLEFGWMPDGRHVVFTRQQFFSEADLWLADTKTGTVRVLTSGIGAEQAPAVSGDGSRIAFVSFQGSYDSVEVPVDCGAIRDHIATARNEITPSWSPHSAHLVYVTDRSGAPEIWLKNMQEGWERPIVTQKEFGRDRTFHLLDAAFSPDGQRVAYRRVGESGEAIWISTIVGDPPVRLTRGEINAFERGPTWSPDGNWIAYYSAHNGRYGVIMKARVNGEGEPVVVRSEGYYPRWSPKGDWILSRGSGLFLTSPDGKVDRKISDRIYMLQGWSKDGSLIYGIRSTDTRHLVLESVDPETFQEKRITDFGPVPASMRYGELNGTTAFRGYSMSPDGRTFLTSVFRATSDIWMLEGFR
jgi:eukaryotic-like serine/threonine-protein kinase